MKKNTSNRFVYLLVAIMVFASCKAKKAIIAPVPSPAPVAATDNSKENLFNAINASQANFSTLNIKAKANLSINNNSNDVSMNLRIKKNEAIWISVTAIAGIEVARALITPDSVKIMNRIENVYIKKPFSYIYGFTNDRVNFKTLQAILTGNTIEGVLTENSAVKGDGQQTTISGLLTNLAYRIKYNSSVKVTQTNLNDNIKGQNITVDYADFMIVGDQQVPHFVKVQSEAGNKSILAEMRYTSIKINEVLDFPFNVPKRFSVKN